jgi:UDP-3-O-acyl-N-acetylglucosamine deacetylase
VLDLMGDLYLLNRPVRGKVTAHLRVIPRTTSS